MPRKTTAANASLVLFRMATAFFSRYSNSFLNHNNRGGAVVDVVPEKTSETEAWVDLRRACGDYMRWDSELKKYTIEPTRRKVLSVFQAFDRIVANASRS